jgi:hypothetical protein
MYSFSIKLGALRTVWVLCERNGYTALELCERHRYTALVLNQRYECTALLLDERNVYKTLVLNTSFKLCLLSFFHKTV